MKSANFCNDQNCNIIIKIPQEKNDFSKKIRVKINCTYLHSQTKLNRAKNLCEDINCPNGVRCPNISYDYLPPSIRNQCPFGKHKIQKPRGPDFTCDNYNITIGFNSEPKADTINKDSFVILQDHLVRSLLCLESLPQCYYWCLTFDGNFAAIVHFKLGINEAFVFFKQRERLSHSDIFTTNSDDNDMINCNSDSGSESESYNDNETVRFSPFIDANKSTENGYSKYLLPPTIIQKLLRFSDKQSEDIDSDPLRDHDINFD